MGKFQDDIRNRANNITGNTISECINKYNSTLAEVLDTHAPLITKTIKLRPNAPWYTDKIRASKRQRRKAERRFRKTKLTVHHEMYRKECQTVNSLIQTTRTEHYSQKIIENSRDQRALYKITNNLLQKEIDPPLPTHESVDKLCDQFANFFQEKIAKIRQNLELGGNCDSVADYSGPVRQNILPELSSFRPATEDEVSKLISKSNSSTCSLDPLPTSLVKECKECLLPVITNLVNISLSTSEMSTELKEALVKPLLKKASLDPDIFKHFRPVSNLSYISKLIEKVVSIRYNEHLTKNGLKEKMQSAYKSDHSTETALLKVQSDILQAMDDSKVVVLVLLDLSAAFDTIDHKIMLERLQNSSRVTGSALDWFRSYLSERTQKVQIRDETSQPVTLIYGVPQGSVLGPQMYADYTTPLGNIARKYGLNIHVYADDTQLYLSFSSQNLDDINSTIRKIEECVEEIKQWMQKNKLQLNDEKTEVILFGTKLRLSQLGDFKIKIGDHSLKPATSARNLGVIFDSGMEMKHQVSAICKNAFFQIRNISKIRKFLTEDATKSLIQSLVMSRLDYGNSLLYGLPITQIERLQRVQNTAARLIKRLPRSCHITPVLRNLHWLPVPRRIEYKILLHVYKAVNGMAPDYLSDLLELYVPGRALRSQGKKLLRIPRTNLKKYGDRTFTVAGPKLWNKLPEEVKEAETVSAFKRLLKTHLFRTEYC